MKRYLLILAILALIGTASAANLFNASEEVTNSAWTKSYINKFYNNTFSSPTGTWTGDSFNTSPAGIQMHGISQAIPITYGQPYTMSAYFKKNGMNNIVQLVFQGTKMGTAQYTNANISSCEVTATGGNTSNTWATANGSWCRISHTATSYSTGTASAYFLLVNNDPDAARALNYEGTGNTSESMVIWGMQAEQASGPTDYNVSGGEDTGGGWASFTPTSSVNKTAYGVARVNFTDTSTATDTPTYLWTYRNATGDNITRTFSTIQSPQWVAFQAPPGSGAWNYSIQLTVDNGTANSTPHNTHWVNVSRFNQTGTDTLPLSPANHVFRLDISNTTAFPVDTRSTGWITAIDSYPGAFGGPFKPYASRPIMYVDNSADFQNFLFDINIAVRPPDRVPYPLPEDYRMEISSSDSKMSIVNRETDMAYDMVQLNTTGHPYGRYPNGSYVAGVGIAYSLNNLTMHSPAGYSPTLVTGMTDTPLLFSRADVASGSLDHAVGFGLVAVGASGSTDYLWPAHATATTGLLNSSFPKHGARIRLKSSYNIDNPAYGYTEAQKILLRGLQKYGGIFSITGGSGIGVNMETGTLTDAERLGFPKSILPISSFEFVNESAYRVSSDSYEYAGYVPGVAPVANFTADKTAVVVSELVTITDHSTNNPLHWTYTVTPTSTMASQEHGNLSIRFTSVGVYMVNLTVSNDNGTSTMSKPNYITVTSGVTPPVAAFSCSPVIGYSPLSVACGDTSTNTPTSWYWDLGDGNTSTSQNPSHTYSVPGSYTVRLNATNAGGFDWENKTGYIAVNAPPIPAADFYADNVNVTVGGTVQFHDYSTNSPTSWLWQIYDSYGGNTSTSQNPTHTYNTLGNYSVTLTATNGYGSDTETKTNYIHVIAGIPPTPTPTPTGTPTPTPTLTSAPPHSDGYSPHMRSMAVETIATIPTERYNALMGALAFTGNETTETPNWSAVPPEIIGTYTDYMGPIALLIIFLIPFGMIWMSHGNMKLLSILGFITCLFVFWYLPSNYAFAAEICMVISVVGFFWGLYKQ